MFLQRLEIAGFKSFANKTVLEFPAPKKNSAQGCGIVSVVGPNGSGKSNIADAIRWVLGEQSIKLLRGKKTEDVIFSGSDKKARLGMAEASIFLNNEDRSLDIDYPEVAITRRVYRDGNSEYFINKNAARLQDVLMLAAKASFGQKSYSVIGQGMVDAFLNATATERKDYLDEAVGVKQFQIKRDQSLHKLETTWKNLKQAKAVLEEIEPRLNSLQRQVRRLEKREEVEKELVSAQKSYYGTMYIEMEKKQKDLKPRYEELEKQFNQKARELSEVQNQLNVLEKEDSRTEVFNSLQQKYQKVLDQKNIVKEEQLILENKIELLKHKEIARVVPLQLDQVLEKLKEVDRLHKDFFRVFSSAKTLGEFQALKIKFQEVSDSITRLVGNLEKPKVEKQIPQEPDSELMKKAREVIEKLKKLDIDLDAAKKEFVNFNQSEEQKKGKFFELQRKFQSKQNEYNGISRQLSDIRIELAKHDTRVEDIMLEIKQELKDESWLKDYKEEHVSTDELMRQIHNFKHQLDLIGGIDLETVKEYKETKERYDFLDTQCNDLSKSIESLKTIIIELDNTIHHEFNASFKNINCEFQKFFKVLFHGGKAELVLIKESEKEEKKEKEMELAMEGVEAVDEAQEEDEIIKKMLRGSSEKVIKGVEIIATPPGKKLKSINMMSGGERALTSIALISAIIANNPPPFVVLDEVDAALDEANSERFAAILDDLSHKTQFVVVTHNRATMYRAVILYGVTMGDDGVSKILSLKMEEAEKIVK